MPVAFLWLEGCPEPGKVAAGSVAGEAGGAAQERMAPVARVADHRVRRREGIAAVQRDTPDHHTLVHLPQPRKGLSNSTSNLEATLVTVCVAELNITKGSRTTTLSKEHKETMVNGTPRKI